jgi:hypothetical protein
MMLMIIARIEIRCYFNKQCSSNGSASVESVIL